MKLETYFSSTRPRYRGHQNCSKTILTSSTDETASILTQDALHEVVSRRETHKSNTNDTFDMFIVERTKKSRKPRKPRKDKSSSSKDKRKTSKGRSMYKEVEEGDSRRAAKGGKKTKTNDKQRIPVQDMESSTNTDELSPEEDTSDNSSQEFKEPPVHTREQHKAQDKSRRTEKKAELGISEKQFHIQTEETANGDMFLSKEDMVALQMRNRCLPRESTSSLHKVHQKSEGSNRLGKPHADHGCSKCKRLSTKSTGVEHVQCVCRKSSRDSSHDCYLQLQINEQVEECITQYNMLVTTKEPRKPNGSWRKLIPGCLF